MTADVTAVVLAAGGATRFGGAKQAAVVGGVPLVVHAVRAAREAGIDRVVVVVGGHESAVRSALVAEHVRVEPVPAWRSGQATSLQVGLGAAGAAEWVLVLLADQPGIGSAAVKRILSERGDGVPAVRATYAGRPGHPVLLHQSLRPSLQAISGDTGARSVLAEISGVRHVACDDLGDPADIDTRADLERARRAAESGTEASCGQRG